MSKHTMYFREGDPASVDLNKKNITLKSLVLFLLDADTVAEDRNGNETFGKAGDYLVSDCEGGWIVLRAAFVENYLDQIS